MSNNKNTVGEYINLEEFKKGRIMDMNEFRLFLKKHGPRYWSWGAHGLLNIYDTTLRFRVNGHNHKGHVYIHLNAMDEFDVYLTTTHGLILQEYRGIGIENIFDLLDEKIEKIAAYKY